MDRAERRRCFICHNYFTIVQLGDHMGQQHTNEFTELYYEFINRYALQPAGHLPNTRIRDIQVLFQTLKNAAARLFTLIWNSRQHNGLVMEEHTEIFNRGVENLEDTMQDIFL